MLNGNLLDKTSLRADFDQKSNLAVSFYDQFSDVNISRVYPSKHLCDEKFCYAVKDQDILISDFDHPSSNSAKKIAADIVSKIDPIKR